MEDDSLHTFQFGPFAFVSELDVPELRGLQGSCEIEVSIRIGGLPDAIDGGLQCDPWWTRSPVESLLDIPSIARFYIGHGNQIRIEPASDALLADITVYLLGSVFGTLCHQNGLLPLHASAVEVGGSVTAFLGDSGAGKSTLAAFLARRNFPVVSDDICLIDTNSGTLRVIPVAGWLKLWRQSLEQIGEAPDESRRVFSEEDKYRMHLDTPKHLPSETLRLRNVIFLNRPALETADGAESTLTELPPSASLARLMNMTYLSYLMETATEQTTLFRRCALVLGSAKAFELIAPKRWDRMEAVVDLIECRLLTDPA